jgi:hypothetical protein
VTVARSTTTLPNPSGTAFATITAALDAAGMTAITTASGAARYTCPWASHRSGGRWPLSVTPTSAGCQVHCFGGCATEDVLRQAGLPLSALYDNPTRRRPTRNEITRAWSKVKGFTHAEKLLYKTLFIDHCDNTTAFLPPAWQPKVSLQQIAATNGFARSTVETAFAKYTEAGWLTRTCAREGCERAWPHAIRGHLPWCEIEMGGNWHKEIDPENRVLTQDSRSHASQTAHHQIDPENRVLTEPSLTPNFSEIDPEKHNGPGSFSQVTPPEPREEVREDKKGVKPEGGNSSPDLTLLQGGKKPGRPQLPMHAQREALRLLGLGWTQQQTADYLGCGKGAIHRAVVRHRLADEHGVSLDEISFCRSKSCGDPALRSAGYCARHGGAA